MAHHVAPFAAVDIIDKQLIILQLASSDGQLSVHRWHCQKACQPSSPARFCRALMTLMEHRAVHYQQLSKVQHDNEIRETVNASLGLSGNDLNTLTLDYQSSPFGTHVISGHQSQVRKKQQQFAKLKCPVTIVEPAFQAVVRAVNFLLAMHPPAGHNSTLSPHWQILQLSEPLSTLIRCHHGSISGLSFHSESELSRLLTGPSPVFYFGDDSIADRMGLAEYSIAKPLALPDALLPEPLANLGGHLIPLFGCALRGFIKWHH